MYVIRSLNVIELEWFSGPTLGFLKRLVKFGAGGGGGGIERKL